ncbi:hypothetical protein BHYA_0082g00140 [Botrytis hyacinthi]|uniref:Uncharacterized protein n=1 Tax=Botrytis hyacinthi TaxID=278943 RepID=A0A4Z1GTB0_9HELO|nr:hypothetical protein BHYA_0082g00140 [Botrytis hyacinthi]
MALSKYVLLVSLRYMVRGNSMEKQRTSHPNFNYMVPLGTFGLEKIPKKCAGEAQFARGVNWERRTMEPMSTGWFVAVVLSTADTAIVFTSTHQKDTFLQENNCAHDADAIQFNWADGDGYKIIDCVSLGARESQGHDFDYLIRK